MQVKGILQRNAKSALFYAGSKTLAKKCFLNLCMLVNAAYAMTEGIVLLTGILLFSVGQSVCIVRQLFNAGMAIPPVSHMARKFSLWQMIGMQDWSLLIWLGSIEDMACIGTHAA